MALLQLHLLIYYRLIYLCNIAAIHRPTEQNPDGGTEHKKAVLAFALVESVSFTNNQAEQDLHPAGEGGVKAALPA